MIGFAAGDIPKMPLNLALLKGCDIRGVFWGAWARLNPEKNRANLEKLVKWTAEGKISSHVDRTFPLAQTADALKVLAGRKAMGKVILHPLTARDALRVSPHSPHMDFERSSSGSKCQRGAASNL